MIYDFESRSGKVIGVDFPIGTAPKIGEELQIGRRVYRRIPSRLRVQDNTKEFVSNALPRWYAGAKRHTKDGKPIFTNKAQVADTVAWAKHNDSTPDGDLIYD